MFTLCWAGGWLLSAHVFRLRKREIPLAGMGIGFLLFILVSDLLAFFLPLTFAFWCSASTIIILGLLAAWRSNFHPRFQSKELLGFWRQGVPFTLILLLFSLIQRGLTIFDEYSNLPLVGTLASGIFPPRFYLDNQIPLYYHHGLHLFAASLVRVGGLMVWSAFDLSRSFTIVLTVFLAWLWLRRYTRNGYFLFASLLLILFASGARWLLLFLPQNALENISSSVTLQGSAFESASNLKTALVSPWNIESGSPFPFPFAFANGIFPPLSLALGGSGAAPQLTLFVLLLLARRRWQLSTGVLFGMLLASLGLTGEYLLGMAWIGIFLTVMLRYSMRGQMRMVWQWTWVFVPSFALVPLMGGVLTGISRAVVARMAGSSVNNLTFTGISMRWPPAFTSSHLGSLSIFDPNQLIVALAEIGPVILLAPLVIWIALRSIRSNKLVLAGIGIGTWIGFLAPLFFQLSFSDRDVSRIIGISVFAWLGISLPWIWTFLRSRRDAQAAIIGLAGAAAMLSGLALLPSQWIAIQQTHYSYFIDEPDARMSKFHWDELNRDAQVLDLSLPSRPATLFGLNIGHAFQNIDTPYPEYASLLKNPDPVLVAWRGYSYIYMDRNAWQKLTNVQKNAFEHKCVRQLAEYRSATNDFRRLYDVSGCNK